MEVFYILKRKIFLLFFLFFFACAKPEVVNIINPGDKDLNCLELENSVAEAQKFKRDALYEKDNMARFIIFWPAAASTFHNADKAIKAANDRTYHLLKLMKNKNCKGVDLINSEILKRSTETIPGQLQMVREMYQAGDLTKKEYRKAKEKILELK